MCFIKKGINYKKITYRGKGKRRDKGQSLTYFNILYYTFDFGTNSMLYIIMKQQ